MLIIALVLAVVGLAALVTAVVTSNELIAWVCIAASLVGVLLLIVDAVRERSRRDGTAAAPADTYDGVTAETEHFDADYPDDTVDVESYGTDPAAEPDADTRAVPFDERHEFDERKEDEPASRAGDKPANPS